MGIGRWLRHVRARAFAELRGDAGTALLERRELALLAIDGDAETLTFRRQGISWTVRAVRHTITRNLFVHGRHPRDEVDALADWLRGRGRLAPERPWCVDVGANIGAPTLFFARDLGRRVVAVEPVPENLALLRRNVEANGFAERVRVVHAAVAESEGTISVMRAEKDGQSEVAAPGVEGVASVEVAARRLDDIVAAQGVAAADVAFVWSDTQGFETQVLRSGTALWAAGAPAFVELWPDALDRHGGVPAFLDACAASFRGFIPSADLVSRRAEAEPRPIAELASLLASLQSRGKQTDGLLVP